MEGLGRDLLVAVEGWHELHREELLSAGISTWLRPSSPTSGFSKDSASIDFQRGEVVANAAVWDSGECELMVLRDPAERQVVLDQVNSAEEVHAFLDQSVATIAEHGAT
jgi:hypothetical protein